MGARAGSHFVVLANVEGDVYALEDRCSHENYPLADGELEGKRLTCMHHGATFDATTGRATGLPAIRPVRTFPVEVRGGDILVQVG
jgi:3-phenylpropionate/trans-cinnamate dioxygenase ferredoxin subunit